MKKICLIIFIYFTTHSTFAQQNQIDSLQKALRAYSKEDTVKIALLISLSSAYLSSNPDTSIVLCEQAYKLSKTLGYEHGQAWALHRTGNANWLKGNFPASIEHAFRALRIFETLKNKKGIANCYNLIANTYNMEKNLSKAMEYYEKSIAIFEQLNDKFSIGRAYANMGRTYYMQDKNELALTNLEKALQVLAPLQEKNITPAALNTIGDVNQKLGNYNKALEYYFKSLRITEPLQIKRIITYSTRGISEVYQKEENYKASIEYAEKTFQISREIGYKENIKNSAFILAENYQKLKQYDIALDFYKLGDAVKDSMFSTEKEQQIESLQANYELGKKQQEISLLTTEQELQKKENNILMLVIVLILMILLLVYMNLQWQKKDKMLLIEQKQILQQQKEEIQSVNDHLEEIVADRTQELSITIENLTKQNQDLQQFSYITSHNLRAPVARIQGLINLFNQENMNDDFNKVLLSHLGTASHSLDEVIKDLTNILSIGKTVIIKEKLSLQEIITTEIAHLSEQISNADATIQLELSIDTVYAIKVYIQSIIHNLISNAIKYRASNRPTVITLSSKLIKGFVCIALKDNGLGIEATDPYKIFGLYQRMHTHVEGKGLGLYLVKTQVEAMSGRIEVETKVNKGTTFRVYIPYLTD
jgi:signal transduction histidine kinase